MLALSAEDEVIDGAPVELDGPAIDVPAEEAVPEVAAGEERPEDEPERSGAKLDTAEDVKAELPDSEGETSIELPAALEDTITELS